MHTVTLEMHDTVLEKFRSFLATLPSDAVTVVEDLDERTLQERKREVSEVIKRVDAGTEQLHDFDSVIGEIKGTYKA